MSLFEVVVWLLMNERLTDCSDNRFSHLKLSCKQAERKWDESERCISPHTQRAHVLSLTETIHKHMLSISVFVCWQ